ncbi:MAG TPA: hypothetical protein VMF32_10810 [Xanthobacteraceae bacterium]|nr:hypothetical protein [Xanthobacteraceae bacterium]
MIDMQEIMNSIAKRTEALAEAWKFNKAAFFDALSAAHITQITVTFDGEGDSGQINDINAFNGDESVPFPERTLAIRSVNWDGSATTVVEQAFGSALETICYDFLEQEHGGWENNDGAFGEFTFNVAGRTVKLEFHGRYMEVATSTHAL